MTFFVISVIFGLIVGSFLNVVINRVKLKETLGGRSHCPNCKKYLKPYHMVPVLSYLYLNGRCAYCRKPISAQYAAVEAFTGIVFGLIQLQYGLFSVDTLALWVLASFLIVLGVYDLKHFILPDKIVFPGIVVALSFALYKDVSTGCYVYWDCATVSGLVGVAIVAGFFFAQFLISQGKWIGFGDVKFGIMLGLLAGFINSIILLFIAYMLGAIVGVGLILMGYKAFSSKMPFGTFLAAAATVVVILGDRIAEWYLSLIGF